MDDWTRYTIAWKSGMPIIGRAIESQGQLVALTYLQWLIHNQQVFEQANLAFPFLLCGVQQMHQCDQPCSHINNVHYHDCERKKKSMREILEEHLDEVIKQNGKMT